MFMRRRPLLRAAAVGGGAYMAGKHMARKQDDQYAAQADQDQRISDLEQQQQQQQQAAPAVAATASSATIDQLKQLSELHQQGVLTDAEFAAAKAKLLGT
jgi:membrane protease subunit (stomatin/prohibitin family)